MKILLTGANGFVGSFMQRLVPCIPIESVGQGPIDMRNRSEVRAAVRACAPDAVVHLAAQTSVPESFEDPTATYEINFIGTFNLLDALKCAGFSGTFLFIGSADAYGIVSAEQLPITEEHPLRPRNPYAVSKAAAEALCIQYSATEQFKTVMARPFNHTGPGQREQFAVSGFAKQIIEIKCGRRDPILRAGDVDVTRDFTDVRDVVLAYKALLENGETGEAYNVCSGKELAIKDIIAKLAAIAGVKVTIQQDPALLRPAEQRRQVGSHCKLHRRTGWRPSIAIDESLRQILNYWERELS